MTSHTPHLTTHLGGQNKHFHQVSDAIANSVKLLLSQQNDQGFWWYTLEANDTINAEYLFLLEFLNIDNPALKQAICNWIVKNQNADGSWSLYKFGAGDLSCTVECYLALKINGYSIDSEVLLKAKSFILEQGGITNIRIFTRIHLALWGLVPWSVCPKMPIEFIQMPEWAPLNIYEFSSWARACIVPLLILLAQKKTFACPTNLDELYATQKSKSKWHYKINNLKRLSFEYAFIQIDRSLSLAEKLGTRVKIRPLRKQSLKKCEMYIREHLETTEDIFPALFYGILALDSLGYTLDDKHIQKGLAALSSFQIVLGTPNGDGANLPASLHEPQTFKATPTIYQQCCISPIWDTAWAMTALLKAAPLSANPQLLKAARLLLRHQVTDVRGDWTIKNPNTEPGGWSFEFANKHYPDTDDTIEVLTALHLTDLPYRELKEPFQRGLNWLLSMQSDNGGFASFDKNNDLKLLNKIPFSDHGACLDPATPDITARVIEFLIKTAGFAKNSLIIQNAANFIAQKQEADGSFWGRWGVNYIYGTWCVLSGLSLLHRPEDQALLQRATDWLKSVQNSDGGYGEACASYDTGCFVPQASCPSQTAWALLGLIAAGQVQSQHAKNAAEYLLRHQNTDGTWDEETYTGTGFPGHFYLRYHGYRHYFPLLALAEYLSTNAAKLTKIDQSS